jgi:hypothetical protein
MLQMLKILKAETFWQGHQVHHTQIKNLLHSVHQLHHVHGSKTCDPKLPTIEGAPVIKEILKALQKQVKF